jgi:hypothetical protein
MITTGEIHSTRRRMGPTTPSWKAMPPVRITASTRPSSATAMAPIDLATW